MRQRVVIAIALSCDPDLLICDRPTTALDVTIQAKILELIAASRRRGISVIYITHDLGVVARWQTMDVMYAGKIVETGTIDGSSTTPSTPIHGACCQPCRQPAPPTTVYTPFPARRQTCCTKPGDAFAPRNRFALNIDDGSTRPCSRSAIPLCGNMAAGPRAPKVEMPPELKGALPA